MRSLRFGLVLLLGLSQFSFSAVPRPSKAPQAKWLPYHSEALQFALKYPAAWSVREKENAVAFNSPQTASSHAAMGILKSSQKDLTIDQAADSEAQEAGNPKDWIRTPARVDGRRAIKIVSPRKQDPQSRRVEYYVEGAEGYYLIQCLAPQNEWATYSPLFTTMITTFHFSAPQ